MVSNKYTTRRTYYVKCAETTTASRTHQPARSKETPQSQHGHLRFGSQSRHAMKHAVAIFTYQYAAIVTWDGPGLQAYYVLFGEPVIQVE